MNRITLTNDKGAHARISEYGAQLLKWTTSTGKDWVFLSKLAQFESGKAIRGGVPIIFPQFNEFGPGPRHGFARTHLWQRCDQNDAGENQVTFQLSSSEQTYRQWPHHFSAFFSVKLIYDQLIMKLTVINTDNKPLEFTAALHTYFAVSVFKNVRLSGLNGTVYWDNDGSDFDKRFTFTDTELRFDAAIDRIFFNVTKPLLLQDEEAALGITMTGFEDVVVWNPGEAGAKALQDLADEEYTRMVCVEAAVIDRPIRLQPEQQWEGTQVLTQA